MRLKLYTRSDIHHHHSRAIVDKLNKIMTYVFEECYNCPSIVNVMIYNVLFQVTLTLTFPTSQPSVWMVLRNLLGRMEINLGWYFNLCT